MKKEQKTIIQIEKILAPIIGSRDVIDSLREIILKADTTSVVLNFKNVEFISRSAAHELLLLQQEMHHKGKELSFEDANSDITAMLRVIAANRALPKSKKPTFDAEEVDIDSLSKAIR